MEVTTKALGAQIVTCKRFLFFSLKFSFEQFNLASHSKTLYLLLTFEPQPNFQLKIQ